MEAAEVAENVPGETIVLKEEEIPAATEKEDIIVNAKDNDIVAETDPVPETETSVISDNNELNKSVEEEEVVHVEEKSVQPSDSELSWEKIASEITESDGAGEVNTTSGTFDVFVTEEQAENNITEVIDSTPAEETETEESKQENAVVETENTTESQEAEKVEESIVEEQQPESEQEVVAETSSSEIIQITELKEDEQPSTSSETIEYTVVEADDVETHEIIEKHLAAQTESNNSGTETLLIINESDSVEETNILTEQDDSTSSYNQEVYIVDDEGKLEEEEDEEEEAPPPKKIVKIKKQRGRKPTLEIPLHVLGRDITKPNEGVSNGGRTLPKPRLGVKVPYKNLTSQIVSKADIEKEIMDRFKSKQEQNAATGSDVMFARKLTQRLAKKLVPEKEKKKVVKPGSSSSGIKDDSDLIAILEGNDEEVPERKVNIKVAIIDDPEREKEIALKQLRELPNTPSSGGVKKIYRTRVIEEKKAPTPVVKQAAKAVVKVEEKKEEEPRLKTGMVVKTYTRKRKSSDAEQPAAKKQGLVVLPVISKHEENSPSSTAYITKSSRVIKRKVIWDPDEAPHKSPIKSPKQETIPQKNISAAATAATPAVKKLETAPATPSATSEKKTVVVVKKIIGKTSPSSSIKRPKRLTEVDKLLMDEGALNMLYDMKTETDDANNKKKQPKIKDFQTKTNAIKNDLQQTTAKDSPQKSLRKKESVVVAAAAATPVKKTLIPTVSPKKEAAAAAASTPAAAITRKKSKDSVRSSIHSPPASPGFNSAEASRIIRRHSSSSFSSIDEDEENGEEVEERVTRKRAGEAAAAKKRTKKNSETKNNSAGVATASAASSKTNNNNTTEKEKKEDANVVGQYKSFTATKSNKLVTIKLFKNSSDLCYLTEQVLKELTKCLEELGDDDDCNVVSITSTNSKIFCKGLDYRVLINEEDSLRKKKANELSNLIKEFLKCLLYFPKVLVAGVQGECVGLGVTMLPLFDMVVASDTSTFTTPYSKLGGVAEAGFLLTIPHVGNHGLASELLYTSQVLKADDVFRRGLVTRLCWPEKYEKDLSNLLADVAKGSSQSLESTKLQVRQNIFESTESCLNKLGKVLVEHWTSPECQENFKKETE